MNKGAMVLCGGKSSRMGRDKATLPFGPELMLQRIVRLISQVVDPSAIVVVAAIGQELPKLPSAIMIARDERPGRGPLEGIAAGLQSIPAFVDAVYATSCDVPLLVPRFLEGLFERLGEHQIVVPVDGEFHHPLSAVYRPNVLPIVRKLLAEEQFRPRLLFAQTATLEINVEELRIYDPGLTTLMNLNRPEDYQAALDQLSHLS